MRYRIAIAAAVLPLLTTSCAVEEPSGDSSRREQRAQQKKAEKKAAQKASEKAKAKANQEKEKAKPRPLAASSKPSTNSTPVYYENCDAVRAAGAAPIRRGDPGYASHLDRDGDGVGCED